MLGTCTSIQEQVLGGGYSSPASHIEILDPIPLFDMHLQYTV